ncbi:MAG: Gfo/Idh/MocA family oxidoreductase [Gemmatimonadaceae bacterium]|nr:Gfo/Idh/MocA family oxidoreductase [Gemmatimonadaceae bacterium]
MAEEEKAVGIGFIGCGGNARGHMNRLAAMERARLAAVCDIDEGRARQAAQTTGAEAFTDFRRMLERDDLDAVYLSLPVFAHGEPELAVIERGLPFFVEKPVARHLDQALEIDAAVEAAGLITCVGYQLRYLGSTDIARQSLEGAAVSLASGRYWSGSGRVAPDHKSWVTTMAQSGGQLVEQATHTLDMMRFLVGEVGAVTARHANRQVPHIDCPDVHAVILEFESGALGTLTTTWAYDNLDWSETNIVDVLYNQCLLTWGRERVAVRSRRPREDGEGEEMATEVHTAPGPGIDEVFVEAVAARDGSRIRSPYADAVKSLALCLAALEAGETGRTVTL